MTLLELLDIDADDLLAKFADRVRARKDYLLAEVEIMNIDDPELDDEDEFDGYQIERIPEDDEDE